MTRAKASLTTLLCRLASAGIVFLCTLPLIALAGPATKDAGADALLLRARQVTGGANWSAMHSARMSWTERYGQDGSRHVDQLLDLDSGHYAKSRTQPSPWSSGWDGKEHWGLEAGKSYTDTMTRVDLSEAWRNCLGYWFDRCGKSTRQVLERREYRQQSFQVVRIAPEQAAPFEFWINEKTGRIERLQTYDDWGRPLCMTDYADFRRSGRVILPFSEHRTTADETVDADLDGVAWNEDLAASSFSRPPGSALEGFPRSGENDAVRLPFNWCAGHICVPVEINGAGPFQFVVDTGAQNILAPALVEQLQLKIGRIAVTAGLTRDHLPTGETRVALMQVAGLSARDLPFSVMELPKGFPIKGVLGREWLEQCVLEIDFEAAELILHDPARFHYRGKAMPVDLIFPRGTARIRATLDGHRGTFGLDTGADDGLTITDAFAREAGVDGKEGMPEKTASATGVDGRYAYHMRRAGSLVIGGIAIPSPTVGVADSQSGGLLGDPGVDGNIGIGILRQFHTIFDWQRHTAYFEKRRPPGG